MLERFIIRMKNKYTGPRNHCLSYEKKEKRFEDDIWSPSSTRSNLNVSRIMVKRTNLPRSGTTREVGGMISARRRKNTVRESRIEMDRETWGMDVLLRWTPLR